MAQRLSAGELRAAKAAVWRAPGSEAPRASFERLRRAVEHRVAEVRDRGSDIVPVVQFDDVARGAVPPAALAEVRARGVCILRGTVPAVEAAGHLESARRYVHGNAYATQRVSDEVQHFFAGDVPQIFGVYWSEAQVALRQHARLHVAQQWLATLWCHADAAEGGEGRWAFDPSRTTVYADRLRIRNPGNVSGLPAHVDGGSVERFVDPGYKDYYREVFGGRWEDFDPWDGVRRMACEEWPASGVCTVSRLFQGFVALSAQGPGDGTLQVVPFLREAVSFLLLRALQDDVPDDDPFAAAHEGKQHQLSERWHAPLLEGLVTIPEVQPGDSVWWHPDIIHAVERQHRGAEDAAVCYIPCTPLCEKNARYLPRQRDAFLAGQAGPDFPQEGREVAYAGRATEALLSELGRQQMGLSPWALSPGAGADAGQAALVRRCNTLAGHEAVI